MGWTLFWAFIAFAVVLTLWRIETALRRLADAVERIARNTADR